MTEVTENPIPSPEPQVRWFIVLRPILIWLFVSLFILGYDYDRVNAPKTIIAPLVTIDNVPQRPGEFNLEIDGSRASPSDVIKVGNRNIRIWGRDTTVFETNHFVWYGTNRLPRVALERLRGEVDLTFSPAPNTLSMTGPYDELIVSNIATLKTNIPVGNYSLTLRYGEIERTDSMLITTNHPLKLLIRPKIGIAVVNSIPHDAEYHLESTNTRFRPKRGTLPLTLALESGSYTLEAWRGNYRKRHNFLVEQGKTNVVTIPFEYGNLDISTVPAGVRVSIDHGSFGVTPTNMVLQPGSYQVRLTKPGFHSLATPITITPNQTVTLSTNLVNMGFSQALANAKRYSRSKDFDRALESIESALSLDPSHSESQQLRSVYQRELSLIRAKEAVAARRQENMTRFSTLTRSDKDNALFDTLTWSFGATFDHVRIAVKSAISKTSAHYEVEAEQTLDPNSVFFRGKSKGLTAHGRHCAVLVCNNQANEIQVIAKFWDYIPASGSGISIASLLKIEEDIPVHPNRFQASQRQSVLDRRKAIADEFKGLIDTELAQNN